jgi:hypothetical protein
VPSSLPVGNIVEALEARQFPSVTTWNRLEGTPRTVSLERALRAEVRDALWMLTKQWQMGEFRGSDAGSPISAKLRIDTTRLTKYQPGTHATRLFAYEVPLEATVERRPVPLRIAGRPVAFDLRLAMGREWLALIEDIGKATGGYQQPFLDTYPIAEPNPTELADADRCAEPQLFALFAALAGRAMDGGALYEHLIANPANHAYDGVAGVAPSDQAALDQAAKRFLAWFERLILQPPANEDAWSPPQLDYAFAASAPEPDGSEKVYAADAYGEIRLDWYSLDVDATGKLEQVSGSEATGLPAQNARTMLPVPVSFAGMPNTRWWTFEDAKTNYGDIDANTTDLATLLFLEFALVYANDWFVIPYTLPSGAVATVRGMAVTNTFGERFWIEAADAGADADWQRWSMFTIDVQNDAGAAADTSLLLLPTVAKVEHGPPTEQVELIRDEVANMVWGVETIVPLASGESAPGRETARSLHAYLQALLPKPPPAVTPPEDAASIRYQIMSGVPENWIPFLPVHVDGSNREIQLQRAAMPRILEGDPNPPEKVQPRTVLLRQGLDQNPPETYYVYEEEALRAGTRLLQSFERTRWSDGRVYVWLRVRRQTGRGEGSSGLKFDELMDESSAGGSSAHERRN